MDENNLENVTNEEVAETAQAAEEATEAAETVQETTETVTEEAAEETADVAETAEEEAEDVKASVKAAAAPVKKAVKQAPVIKKKKGINTTTLTVIIVCAVVVLACVAFVLYKKGVFHIPQKAVYTIAAHDTIDVEEPEITDDDIDSYVTTFQTKYETTEEVTTGTVEDGDELHLQYVGTIDGEEFDGGSTDEDGADLTIGSGSYIDGFEDGLIGANIGDTVTLNLTFPDDYSNEDVAGKDVQFVVTIEYKSVTNTPDFTDDFVKENSYEYTESIYDEGTQIDTVEDYRQFVYDKLYDSQIDSNLATAIFDLIDMTKYDEVNFTLIHDATINQLETYGSYYGYDADTFAQYYGYDDAEAYATDEAQYELKLATVYADLAAEFGISHTDEEVDASIQEYMDENGYSDAYTLESFKETSGEGWLYMYKNYQMNYDGVMDVMRERMNLVPAAEEETTEETTAAE